MQNEILDALDLMLEEPEEEQYTYFNGHKTPSGKREKARKPYTEQELIEKYDEAIARNAKQWGREYFYTEQARQAKERNLKDWHEGKVVLVYSEDYHADGMDWANSYYSDGTKRKICFGYMD